MRFAVRVIYQPASGGPAQTRLRLFGFSEASAMRPLTTCDAIGVTLDELEQEGEIAPLAPLAVVAHGGLAAEAWANAERVKEQPCAA